MSSFTGYMWFVVHTALSFTAATSYYSMSFKNGIDLLSALEIENGMHTSVKLAAEYIS